LHQSANDPTVDRAVLHSGNATEFDEIVAVLDALYGTKRAYGGAKRARLCGRLRSRLSRSCRIAPGGINPLVLRNFTGVGRA